MIKLTPRFEFDRHSFGFGFVFLRENESEKYIRECRTINYLLAIMFFWFTCGFELKITKDVNDKNGG